ncbi:uncharacterized protein LOC125140039 isoform X3 [Tachysurus fulvidraco]|uniref:uncharacterized protein LOC125140039 isoform X3 n=1 Tax=Tachysurus fulvidraco TaxID=1234273 RepID=UPI001FF01D94|nr:uncharacterized protein LOC125140039 isoform X3 [Tachysurus fulvidraco]
MQESSGINLFVVRHFKLREVHSTTMVPEQRRVTSMTLNRRCQITCSRQPASPPQLLHLHQPSSTMRSLVVLMFICMLLPKEEEDPYTGIASKEWTIMTRGAGVGDREEWDEGGADT